MSTDSVYAQLMREMGAPRWDGFNPIAPRSHRWMMDVSQPEEIRVFGWSLWRTIDRDPEGKTGTPKRKRTYFAHDVRGQLSVRQLAEDLGMSLSNASDALKRTVEKERIRIDDKGRICPRGDVPEPTRIKSEGVKDGDDNVFCTDKLDPALRLYFQRLDVNRLQEYLRRYFAMPKGFREHLEKLDPEQRAFHTWEHLEAEEYGDQIEADVMAAARAMRYEHRDQKWAAAGYQDQENRGRPKVSRELTIELKVKTGPEEFSIQKSNPVSAQNGHSDSYKTKNGSAQKPHPYGSSSDSQSSQSGVKSDAVEKATTSAESNKGAAAPRPPESTKNLPIEVVERNRRAEITRTAERLIGRRLRIDNPLRDSFPQLALDFDLPVYSVCAFLEQECKEQRRAGQAVPTLAALHDRAVKNLRAWSEKHRTEVEHWRRIETRHRAEGVNEPFDPASFNAEMAKAKGMA